MGFVMMRLSSLAKTWIFDLDGTLVKHNGYMNGGDELLPGVKDFFARIPAEDKIVLLTGREESARESSLAFLASHGLRIDHAIFGLSYGERILLNDSKPSGLQTAYAVNLPRDTGPGTVDFSCDPELIGEDGARLKIG